MVFFVYCSFIKVGILLVWEKFEGYSKERIIFKKGLLRILILNEIWIDFKIEE